MVKSKQSLFKSFTHLDILNDSVFIMVSLKICKMQLWKNSKDKCTSVWKTKYTPWVNKPFSNINLSKVSSGRL